MDDYRWFESETLFDRFPTDKTWIVGADAWRERMRQFSFPSPAAVYEFLNAIRSASRARPTPQCPRVFVSHRQVDEKVARRLAWLAWNEGFDYWLDVIDLDPQRNQQVIAIEQSLGRSLTLVETAVLIAAIIEMALLNCTHVIAAMTRNTAGSQWVPYEYGRAKDAAPVSLQAACWRAPALCSPLAEYLYLGEVLDSEQQIRAWLKGQMRGYPKCSGAHRNGWPEDEPDPLPTP